MIPRLRQRIPLILLLALAAASSACRRESPPPNVGACAEFGDDLYYAGNIGIGTCLAGPSDLEVYTWSDPDDPTSERAVLYIVNSNDQYSFSSGSLLAVDLDALEAILDATMALNDFGDGDSDPIPAVLTMDALELWSADPASGDAELLVRADTYALPLPTLSGQVLPVEIPGGVDEAPAALAFVSNRLSETTETYADDFLYAIDLRDPLRPEFFDHGGPGDGACVQVGEDPFGMARASASHGDYLYVVNQSGHSVSLVDLGVEPFEEVSEDAVGLATAPAFRDRSFASKAHMPNISVATGILSDEWTLSYVEGSYRMWFPGDCGADGAVCWAEGGSSLAFRPMASSPVLEPSDAGLCDYGDEQPTIDQQEACPWDAGGLGPFSLLAANDVWTFAYEGWSDDGVPAIGLAQTPDLYPGDVARLDPQGDGKPYNDAVVSAGPSGSFYSLGVMEPWLQRHDETYDLYVTGLDDQGEAHLGVSTSSDLLSFDAPAALRFFAAGPDAEGTFDDADEITDTMGETFDAAGVYDTALERRRLWFMRDTENGPCLAYAEAPGNATDFKIGSLDQGPMTEGCVDLGTDVVDMRVSSPSVVLDGRLIHLWYVAAPLDGSAPPTLRYAYGFDGVTFYPVSEVVLESDEGNGDAGSVRGDWALVQKLSPGTTFQLVGDTYGMAADDIAPNTIVALLPVDASSGYYRMSVATQVGLVLGTGAPGTYVIHEGESEGSVDELGTPAWDASTLGAPAYDPETEALYYTGGGVSGGSAIGIAEPADPGDAEIPRPLAWVNAEAPTLSIETIEGSAGATGLSSPAVVRDGDSLFLYYTESLDDGSTVIRVAEGDGGGGFEHASVLAFAPNAGESVRDPCVLPPREDDPSWHMWFTSVGESAPRIAYASSDDGIVWTRSAGAAFEPGAAGSWDDEGVETPSVVRIDDDQGRLTAYHLYYTGFNGSAYRIGVARAEAGPDPSSLEWIRYSSPSTRADPDDWTTGVTSPILVGSSSFWDVSAVSHPDVHRVGDVYRMWYQGRLGSYPGIGLAESFDGFHWRKVYAPLNADDAFVFRTASLVDGTYGEDASGTPSGLLNGRIPLDVSVTGGSFSGVGATRISVAPDQSIAVVSARFTAGIYVLDVRDDSTDDMLDANYNGVEAILTWPSDTSTRGTRATAFSPDGSLIYALTANPDAVLVFDRTRIEDKDVTRIIEDALIRTISLDPGLSDDEGVATSTDLGPTDLVLSRDGRYLWVAHGNANRVYTIDLLRDGDGAIVKEARNVGENPVALALSPDERYLFVANYLGEVETVENHETVHSTLAVIDADDASPTFGKVVARLKNVRLGQRDE